MADISHEYDLVTDRLLAIVSCREFIVSETLKIVHKISECHQLNAVAHSGTLAIRPSIFQG